MWAHSWLLYGGSCMLCGWEGPCPAINLHGLKLDGLGINEAPQSPPFHIL